MWWSPRATISTTLHSSTAGALSSSGAPEAPGVNGSPPSLPPSTAAGFKKAKAAPCWPLPRMFSAKAPALPTTSRAEESALTPTATSGGSNEVCVTKFTVAAATAPSGALAVST
jgi:hypothetical protein